MAVASISISSQKFNSGEEKSDGNTVKKTSGEQKKGPDEPFRHDYKLVFAFNGTKYYGWQRQVCCHNTVQETLEEVLRNLFHKPDLAVTGCGRTDTGVHALAMTASFHVDAKIPAEELKSCLNKRIPHDIVVIHAEEKPGFNAHEDACGKAYVYTVKLGEYSLFLPEGCWAWVERGNMEEVRRAFAAVQGTHDFQNFSGRKAPDPVRTVYRTECLFFGPMLCFYISGNGFLHKMVRRIVGGLHEVFTGKCSAEDYIRAVGHSGCQTVSEVAPPCGLYLKKVFYAEEEWKTDRLENPPFFFP